jgi:hypothetical protein
LCRGSQICRGAIGTEISLYHTWPVRSAPAESRQRRISLEIPLGRPPGILGEISPELKVTLSRAVSISAPGSSEQVVVHVDDVCRGEKRVLAHPAVKLELFVVIVGTACGDPGRPNARRRDARAVVQEGVAGRVRRRVRKIVVIVILGVVISPSAAACTAAATPAARADNSAAAADAALIAATSCTGDGARSTAVARPGMVE